ncbi:hypothetical protein SAMN04488051_101690 [Alkalimonas amylolytica]|uniref:Uncharacterized protein n=2 Tax=Alkalimonas amylolytica TaxID=152573 RepID=A0A1H3YJ43_ALKAM|nr:hypothetical protein SAMN04488051_101690 [Alkalimonas amylolytica]
MTEAKPEARLALLVWASKFGAEVQVGDLDWLATHLSVTKSHLRSALDYLVREGYIQEVVGLRVVRQPRKKKPNLVDYALTTASWNLWNRSLSEMAWPDEFVHSLTKMTVDDEQLPTTQSLTQSWQMRLVRSVFVSQANSAGYIVGCDFEMLTSLLGMKEAKVRANLRALVRAGDVSIIANGISASQVFGRLLPIYRVHFTCAFRKTITVGMLQLDGWDGLIRFIPNWAALNKQVSKQKNLQSYPIQRTDLLDDEHYYQLSRFFRSNKKFIYVQHLCQSIIFSLAGDYAAELNYNNKIHHETHQSNIRENLKGLVDARLSESLFNGKQLALETDISTINCYEPDSAQSRRLLAIYLFKQLSAELVRVIDNIANQLKLLVDIYSVQVQVLGYLPSARIAAKIKLPEDTGEDSQADSHATNPRPKIKAAHFMLNVLVPNENFLSSCLIHYNELYAEQSIPNDPRIRIAEVIVAQKPRTNHSHLR